MTPQSSFMILATINPAREAELRRLLASMNYEPGVFESRNRWKSGPNSRWVETNCPGFKGKSSTACTECWSFSF